MGVVESQSLVKRTEWVNWWSIVILISIVASATEAQSPRRLSLLFYDQFGGEVSMTYGGGYALIKCEVRRGGCTTMKLMHEENIEVASRTCENDEAEMRLNITEDTKFGEYFCQNGDDQSLRVLALDLLYRICHKNDGKTCKDNEFCIFKKTPSGPVGECVANIPGTMCQRPVRESQVSMICHGKELSLCHSVANSKYNKEDAVVEEEAVSPCGGITSPSASFESVKRRQNEWFRVTDDSRIITVGCPIGSNAQGGDLTCTLSQSDGTQVPMDMIHVPRCRSTEDFDMPNSVFNRSDVYKFECFITKQNYRAHILVYPITIVGKVECKSEESGGYTRSINCTIDNLPPEFEKECEIILPSGKTVKGLSTSVYNESGLYKAQCTITVNSFAPFEVFQKKFMSEPVKATHDPGTTTTTSTTTTSTLSKSTSYMSQSMTTTKSTMNTTKTTNTTIDPDEEYVDFLFIIRIKKKNVPYAWTIFGLTMAALLTVIVVTSCCCCRYCRRRRMEEAQRKEASANDRMQRAKEKAEAEKRIREMEEATRRRRHSEDTRRNQGAVELFQPVASDEPEPVMIEMVNYQDDRALEIMNMNRLIEMMASQMKERRWHRLSVIGVLVATAPFLNAMKRIVLKDLPNAGDIDRKLAKVRVDMEVVENERGELLNLSKMINFVKRSTVIVGQSPNEKNVYDVLKVLDVEKVSVISLHDSLDRKSRLLENKWLPIKKGERRVFHHPDKKFVSLAITAVNSLFTQPNGIMTMKVEVNFCTGLGIGAIGSEVDIVITPFELDYEKPKNVKLLAEGINKITVLRAAQAFNGRPGVAFLCKNGMEYSPVMAAGHIGYQMYVYTRKVNLVAIARHVAAYRWDAFVGNVLGEETSNNQAMCLFKGVEKLMEMRAGMAASGTQTIRGDQMSIAQSAIQGPKSMVGQSRMGGGKSLMSMGGGQSQTQTETKPRGRQSTGGQPRRGDPVCRIPKARDKSQERTGASRGRSADKRRR